MIGCDSLATVSQPVLDPAAVSRAFFDSNGELLKDDKGVPILSHAAKLGAFIQRVPKSQLPNVTKIFQLEGILAGALFAGISGIGDATVRNLVEQFLESSPYKEGTKDGKYTIENVCRLFASHLSAAYEKEFASLDKSFRPVMEIIVSGYSFGSWKPEVFKITLPSTDPLKNELVDFPYTVIFGGQSSIIERVVYGVDTESFVNLSERSFNLIRAYRNKVIGALKEAKIEFAPPEIDENDESLALFSKSFGGVKGLFSDIAGLSEQAAIDFAEFLISTMVRGQQYSGTIPTVGGQIHMAIITKKGFKWISKEEYTFQGVAVPKFDNHENPS